MPKIVYTHFKSFKTSEMFLSSRVLLFSLVRPPPLLIPSHIFLSARSMHKGIFRFDIVHRDRHGNNDDDDDEPTSFGFACNEDKTSNNNNTNANLLAKLVLCTWKRIYHVHKANYKRSLWMCACVVGMEL